MTATPIPRTLAMTMFAELDISVLDELPPGRQPVTTIVLSNIKRDEIIERITNVCKDGQQVYWVCTLIDESDISQFQAAVKTFDYLSEMLPTLSIGLIHGRLKGPEKNSVMNDFKKGNLDLLVQQVTIAESGVVTGDLHAEGVQMLKNDGEIRGKITGDYQLIKNDQQADTEKE